MACVATTGRRARECGHGLNGLYRPTLKIGDEKIMYCQNYVLSANGNDTACKQPAIGLVNKKVGDGTIALNACADCYADIQNDNLMGTKTVRRRDKKDASI